MNILKRALLFLIFPSDCCDVIKRDRKRFHWYVPLIFYTLITLINYSYLFYVHFPLSARSVTNANVFLEAFIIAAPHFSWAVASYAITAILHGESHFAEQLEASTYALMPIIIFVPLLGLFSRILSNSEAGIYQFLYAAVFLWTAVLLFVSLKLLNDYSIGRSLLVTILSLLAMAVMWCVLLLLLSLTVQLFSFFSNIFKEAQFKHNV